jgi:hypothetical protein
MNRDALEMFKNSGMAVVAMYGAIGVSLSLATLVVNWKASGKPLFALQATWLLARTPGLTALHRAWRRVGWGVAGWFVLSILL